VVASSRDVPEVTFTAPSKCVWQSVKVADVQEAA